MTQSFNRQSLKIFFLITLHLLKRNISLVISVILISSLLVFLQLKYNIFFTTNTLSEGFIGTYQERDIPVEVMRLISSGLVKFDQNGRAQPNLVTGWEDTKKDATEFKFKLKDNLKWTDGTPVKSQDLEFSIPDATVTYPDDLTIDFQLKEAYSPFPSLLTAPIIKKGTLIGVGPYTIKTLEKSIIFIKKLTLVSSNPNLPIIYVRFYPTEQVGITGFYLGEVSAIFDLNSTNDFLINPQVKFKQTPDFTKIVTIAFNNKDTVLSNRSLRQALSFSAPQIDKEKVANNPYPPFFWAYNPDSKKYLADNKDAAAALTRAKTNLPDDKLKQQIVLTSAPNLAAVGDKIVSEWKRLGFDATVRIEPGIPQNFQAALITQTISADPDQYLLWHSSQIKTNLSTNLSKYSSVRVDKDLEDGRKATDEATRKTAYYDFQKTLLEDAPAVFLYFPKYNIVYLKNSEMILNKVIDLQIPHNP